MGYCFGPPVFITVLMTLRCTGVCFTGERNAASTHSRQVRYTASPSCGTICTLMASSHTVHNRLTSLRRPGQHSVLLNWVLPLVTVCKGHQWTHRPFQQLIIASTVITWCKVTGVSFLYQECSQTCHMALRRCHYALPSVRLSVCLSVHSIQASNSRMVSHRTNMVEMFPMPWVMCVLILRLKSERLRLPNLRKLGITYAVNEKNSRQTSLNVAYKQCQIPWTFKIKISDIRIMWSNNAVSNVHVCNSVIHNESVMCC